MLKEKEYFCSKGNTNEFITFQFDKEYCFSKIIILYPDSYKKARLKQYSIIGYDRKGNYLKTCDFTNDGENDFEFKIINLSMDLKAAYLKLELSKNFGEEYFCIKKIQFFADITHSLTTE